MIKSFSASERNRLVRTRCTLADSMGEQQEVVETAMVAEVVVVEAAEAEAVEEAVVEAATVDEAVMVEDEVSVESGGGVSSSSTVGINIR